MKEFYTGKYDLVFKTIICNPEDPDMLKEFLKRILRKNIDEIEYRDKMLNFLVKIDGEIIYIELNIYRNSYLYVRNFAYFTEMYSKVIDEGKYNNKLKFLYINLIYGTKNNNDYEEYYVMSTEDGKYIENFKIIEYNMDRLMNYWINKNKKKIEEYKHLIMLDLKYKELSNISKGDTFIKKYEKELNNLNDNNLFKTLITKEENYYKMLNIERYLGEKQGLEKGYEEGTQDTAIKFLKAGVALEKVSEITGISMKKLQQLIFQRNEGIK